MNRSRAHFSLGRMGSTTRRMRCAFAVGSTLAFLSLFVNAGVARATPLGVTLLPAPDIVSTFITVDYEVGRAPFSFLASGFAFELKPDDINPIEAIVGGLFEIKADITSSGAIGANGGTLSILGSIPAPITVPAVPGRRTPVDLDGRSRLK